MVEMEGREGSRVSVSAHEIINRLQLFYTVKLRSMSVSESP